MNQKLATALTGAMGTAGVEAVQQINLDSIQEGTTLITQIIILVATLIGLFKKKKI